MHRTNVLICLRQAILSGLKVSPRCRPGTPGSTRRCWTTRGSCTNYWSGDWNHGTDESIALFGVGCTLEPERLQEPRPAAAGDRHHHVDRRAGVDQRAVDRVRRVQLLALGPRDDRAAELWRHPGTTIATRRALWPSGWPWRRTRSASCTRLGDTEVPGDVPVAGNAAGVRRVAGDEGYGADLAGRDLSSRLRLRPDRLGYRCRPGFASESTYSIRFGPARAFHGHFDHTQHHLHGPWPGHRHRRRVRGVQDGGVAEPGR